jgi:hypothetical protein
LPPLQPAVGHVTVVSNGVKGLLLVQKAATLAANQYDGYS